MGCPSCSTESFLGCIALNHQRFPVIVGQDVTKFILLSLRSEKGLLRRRQRKGSNAIANRVSVASQSSGATTEGFGFRERKARHLDRQFLITNVRAESVKKNASQRVVHYKKFTIKNMCCAVFYFAVDMDVVSVNMMLLLESLWFILELGNIYIDIKVVSRHRQKFTVSKYRLWLDGSFLILFLDTGASNFLYRLSEI